MRNMMRMLWLPLQGMVCMLWLPLQGMLGARGGLVASRVWHDWVGVVAWHACHAMAFRRDVLCPAAMAHAASVSRRQLPGCRVISLHLPLLLIPVPCRRIMFASALGPAMLQVCAQGWLAGMRHGSALVHTLQHPPLLSDSVPAFVKSPTHPSTHSPLSASPAFPHSPTHPPIHPPPLPCPQCAAMALCPESPAWLAREGRPSDAVRALRRLHGTAFRIQDYPKLQQAYIVLDGEEADGQGDNGAASPSGDALQQPLLDSEQGGASENAAAAGGSGGNGGGHPEGAHLGWSALWEPKYRRVMILAAALPLAQQASGGCGGWQQVGWARDAGCLGILQCIALCFENQVPRNPYAPLPAGINTVIFYSSQVRVWHLGFLHRAQAGLPCMLVTLRRRLVTCHATNA